MCHYQEWLGSGSSEEGRGGEGRGKSSVDTKTEEETINVYHDLSHNVLIGSNCTTVK